MKLHLLILAQKFESPLSGYEVHFGTDDMTRLSTLFNMRCVTLVMTGTREGVQSTEMWIDIDGAQPLTQEQWDYISTKVYKLRFIQPMSETLEESEEDEDYYEYLLPLP